MLPQKLFPQDPTWFHQKFLFLPLQLEFAVYETILLSLVSQYYSDCFTDSLTDYLTVIMKLLF